MLPQPPQRWKVTKVVLGLSQLTSVYLQWTSSCSLPASDRNLSVSAPLRRAAHHWWEIQLCARKDRNRGTSHQLLATVVCSRCSQSRRLLLILGFCHVMIAVIVVQQWLMQGITGLVCIVDMGLRKPACTCGQLPSTEPSASVCTTKCLFLLVLERCNSTKLAVASNACMRTKTPVAIRSS